MPQSHFGYRASNLGAARVATGHLAGGAQVVAVQVVEPVATARHILLGQPPAGRVVVQLPGVPGRR